MEADNVVVKVSIDFLTSCCVVQEHPKGDTKVGAHDIGKGADLGWVSRVHANRKLARALIVLERAIEIFVEIPIIAVEAGTVS